MALSHGRHPRVKQRLLDCWIQHWIQVSSVGVVGGEKNNERVAAVARRENNGHMLCTVCAPLTQLFSYWFLHECDHVGGECAMSMIFFVGPCSLGSRQTLMICWNKACRSICKSANKLVLKNKKKLWCCDAPLNLFKEDIIKTIHPLLFHLIERSCMASNMEAKLCSTPILLDEI